jgi:hypothetical protein
MTGSTRVSLALGAGLALTVVTVAVMLSGSPATLAGTNSVPFVGEVANTNGDASACQASETLPRGTSAIRLSLEAAIGPSVSVQAVSGGRVVARGVRGSGWSGGTVTVPVRPVVSRAVDGVTVCFKLGPTREIVTIEGQLTKPVSAARGEGKTLPGRMRIEYMRAGRNSWWSLALPTARRLGLGHAWAGSWVALLLATLMGALVALCSWVLLRELR